MDYVVVAGPFKSRQEAIDKLKDLGRLNHSIFSRSIPDSDGYLTENVDWFIKRYHTLVLGEYKCKRS